MLFRQCVRPPENFLKGLATTVAINVSLFACVGLDMHGEASTIMHIPKWRALGYVCIYIYIYIYMTADIYSYTFNYFYSGLPVSFRETFREPSGTHVKRQLPCTLPVRLPEPFQELPELQQNKKGQVSLPVSFLSASGFLPESSGTRLNWKCSICDKVFLFCWHG